MAYLLADETYTNVSSGVETTVATYTGDGTKKVGGFIARGAVGAEYRLYISTTKLLTYITTTADQLAYVVLPKGITIGSGVACAVKVYHAFGSAQGFYASIFEGN